MSNSKKNIDLTEIKKELKEQKGKILVENNTPPKNSFLHELSQSLNYGSVTEAADVVKKVDQKAEQIITTKKGGAPKIITNNTNSNVSSNVETSNVGLSDALKQHVPPSNNKSTMMNERDDLFNNKLNSQGYATGNDSLNIGRPTGGVMINEQEIANLTERLVGKHIESLNFGTIVEQAMKNTIVELYSMEQMKKAIKENEKLIKGIVLGTIKELQKHNKTKK